MVPSFHKVQAEWYFVGIILIVVSNKSGDQQAA